MLEPAQVPGTFQKAFQLMRSGRPGPVLIDLPIDVQLAEIEFDIETYEPLPVVQARPRPARRSRRRSTMLAAAERPLIVAGGGIINADAADLLVELAELTGVPVVPTLMGWGTIPDDHPLNAGMVGLQTSHRYGNATMLESDFVLGIGNRWANRHTGGLDTYTKGRTFVHVDIEPTQIGRVFAPDYSASSPTPGPPSRLFVEVARERKDDGPHARLRRVGASRASSASGRCSARRQLRQRADQAAARLPGDEQGVRPGHPLRLAPSGSRRSRPPSCCTCSSRGTGSTPARPARWAGPLPAALGVATADPDAHGRGAVR